MLIHDPDVTDPHTPCGVTTCPLCGFGYYVYPAPAQPLTGLLCQACWSGDAPSPRTGPARVTTYRQAIWRAVNRRP